MRIRTTIATGALLLASATFAAAQQPPTPTTPPPAPKGVETTNAWTGLVDIGGRFDNSTPGTAS